MYGFLLCLDVLFSQRSLGYFTVGLQLSGSMCLGRAVFGAIGPSCDSKVSVTVDKKQIRPCFSCFPNVNGSQI